MIKIDQYKETRLSDLKTRLVEINNLIGLDTQEDLIERNDEMAMKLKEKKLKIMKQYYEEMVSIKKEIAKLEGRTSIFETLDE